MPLVVIIILSIFGAGILATLIYLGITIVLMNIKYKRIVWYGKYRKEIINLVFDYGRYYYNKTGMKFEYFMSGDLMEKLFIYGNDYDSVFKNWKGFDIYQYIKYPGFLKTIYKAKENRLI